MRRMIFARLALTNIHKNKGAYLPYIFTCICTIAMLYMMLFLNQNAGISAIPSSGDIVTITFLGVVVIAIFSFVFLLYSNGFLMKQRQKELGLYNILGLEKGHIAKMMLLETVISSLVSFAGGILVGILGSKLALLLLLKLIRVPAQFGFEVRLEAIGLCGGFYGVIFLIILLFNLRRVHVAKPVELLRGGNQGEREPRSKWLMALAGFLCLGGGYYIAVTTKSPLSALSLFFLAVLLVMAGTYLVFTAGSIVVLKMLRRRKSFYYKAKNFTSVSGMLYRMKQNAVGLASICILSTGVLLMISTTVCLNSGLEDVMNVRFPREVMLSYKNLSLEEGAKLRDELKARLQEEGISYENLSTVMCVSATCIRDGNTLSFEQPSALRGISERIQYLTLIPDREYEILTGKEVFLEKGAVCGWRGDQKPLGDVLTVGGESYQVQTWLAEVPLMDAVTGSIENTVLVVTQEDFDRLFQLQKEAYQEMASVLTLEFCLDLTAEGEEELELGNRFLSYASTLQDSEKGIWIGQSGMRRQSYESFYGMFGGLLFLGIFLGALFLWGTAMIIYHKQISEGYEDKERFEIMQKVGMSKGEVRSSIRRQILMVFFIPLLMAALHISMAFPMVKRLLSLFGMSNSGLFALCTLITIGVFSIVYGLIYSFTARSYYRIVERRQ
ncbi:MAG: ABC transporter permease [Eubacteriales bacterium]|nr:ABC transporter permease [Eubacteriales bacterium]